MRDSDSPNDAVKLLPRRRVLGILGSALGCAAAAPVLGLVGCSGGSAGREPPPTSRLPLSRLPSGGRIRIVHRGEPVELSREGEVVTARSLRCTHFGCEVRWDDAEAVYRCPCHDGLFDARGRPVAGPPPRPLRTYDASVTAEAIVVGDEIPR